MSKSASIPKTPFDTRGVHELRPGVIGFRSVLVWCYLLTWDREVVAIDTGVGPHGWWIKRWFRQTGRAPSDLKAILLTHGHIDHMGCAAGLQRWSKAPVFLHPADHDLSQGRYRGPWPSRSLQWAERASNLLRWTGKPRITDELADGQVLPFAGRIEVVGLPGHTLGQVGFHSQATGIFFAADAILARGKSVFFPHALFNLDDRLTRTSIIRVASREVSWIYPGHHRGLEHNLIEDIRRYAARQEAASTPATNP